MITNTRDILVVGDYDELRELSQEIHWAIADHTFLHKLTANYFPLRKLKGSNIEETTDIVMASTAIHVNQEGVIILAVKADENTALRLSTRLSETECAGRHTVYCLSADGDELIQLYPQT